MGDWFYIAMPVPEDVQKTIAHWVLEQEYLIGATLKKPSSYHVALVEELMWHPCAAIVYSYDGRNREALAPWKSNAPTRPYEARVRGVEAFAPADPSPVPIVLTLHAARLVEQAERVISNYKQAGYNVSEFEGGFKPHITIATMESFYLPEERAAKMVPPNIGFRIGPDITTGGYLA